MSRLRRSKRGTLPSQAELTRVLCRSGLFARRTMAFSDDRTQRVQAEQLLEQEGGLPVEQLADRLVPFAQSAYFEGRERFELLLELCVGEDGEGLDALLVRLAGEQGEITCPRLEEAYLELWRRGEFCFFEEPKRRWFLRHLCAPFEAGVLEILLFKRPDCLVAGSCFWWEEWQENLKRGKEDVLLAGEEYRYLGLSCGGKRYWLRFLSFSGEEELERVTKWLVSVGGKGELTQVQPVWDGRVAGYTLHAERSVPCGWGFWLKREVERKDEKGWSGWLGM